MNIISVGTSCLWLPMHRSTEWPMTPQPLQVAACLGFLVLGSRCGQVWSVCLSLRQRLQKRGRFDSFSWPAFCLLLVGRPLSHFFFGTRRGKLSTPGSSATPCSLGTWSWDKPRPSFTFDISFNASIPSSNNFIAMVWLCALLSPISTKRRAFSINDECLYVWDSNAGLSFLYCDSSCGTICLADLLHRCMINESIFCMPLVIRT